MIRIGNRYTLDPEPIGRGGMGEVYRGTDERLGGRVVAVKKLARELWGEDRALERLMREVELPAKVRDKRHIVEVYDVVEEGHHLYVVMEYVAGGRSLEDLLSDGGVGTDGALLAGEARRYLEQACLGLRAIHGSGIVHGDVKARNFLLSEEGVLELADFGLSRLATNPILTTRPWGTARNMAPEVYEGKMSIGSDIYGLGFTFYEVYAGKKAFAQEFKAQLDAASPPVAWMRWHMDLENQVTPLKESCPAVPAAISDHLGRMMAKKENDRPSIDEILKTVRSTDQAGGPGIDPTRPMTAGTGSASRRGRSTWGVKVLAAGMVVLLAGWIFLLMQVLDQRSELDRITGEMSSLSAAARSVDRVDSDLSALRTSVETAAGRITGLEGNLPGLRPDLSGLAGNRELESLREECNSRMSALDQNIKALVEAEKYLSIMLGAFEARDRGDTARARNGVRDALALRPGDSLARDLARQLADLEEEGTKKTTPKPKKEARPEPPGFRYLKEETFSCGGQTNAVHIYRHEKTDLEFVLVPGGTFVMGSDEEDEGPPHEVTIRTFLLCRTECTQTAWDRVGGIDECSWRGGDLPVENVSWSDPAAWCGRAGLRLQSESEWEYACRAGTTTRYYCGDYESSLGSYAWYSDNSDAKTHPVKQKRPNAFGLYDMLGNVWEWCEDKWHDSYDGAPTDGRPWSGGAQSTGSTGAVAGTSLLTSAGLPFATGTARRAATTTWASAPLFPCPRTLWPFCYFQ